MRSQQEGWFQQIFSRLGRNDRNYQDLLARVNAMQQQFRAIQSGGGFGGGSGMQQVCWAKCPTDTVGTTAWPTLGRVSFTSDIYIGSGSSGTKVATGATVWVTYKDTIKSGKLVPCLPNPDGSYDAILDSCTSV